jgi:hypothetical protein
MTLKIAKRGRPSKSDLAARAAAAPKPRTDREILTDVTERFRILDILTKGTVDKTIRAVTITGAPGVGKTHNVATILEHARETKGIKYEVVRGAISAINLYMLAYEFRHAGNVIVLDDADTIFQDEDALNILKVLCDSSDERIVSYRKEANALIQNDIPQSFKFQGAMLFISNLDFQKYVDEGKNKYAQHFEAIMSRSLYLDLRIHTKQELNVWIQHIVKHAKILRAQGLTAEQEATALAFLNKHKDNLRELSLRTVLKVSQLMRSHRDWESIATKLLCR